MRGRDRWKKLKTLLSNLRGKKDTGKLISLLTHSITYDVENVMDKETNADMISSDVYEARYLNNYGRSIKQQLETKFSTIYLLTKKKNGSIKNAIINIRGYRAIKSNQLFDIGYYLKDNPDVRSSGDDPIMHYIYYGFKEGRNPSADFDVNYYLQRYTDVKDSNLNPLIHYSLHGMKEGRKTIENVE